MMWLSTQCSAVVDEIISERGSSFGGAGLRLRIMHAELSKQLANGSKCSEIRQGFDRRWLPWHNCKTGLHRERI